MIDELTDKHREEVLDIVRKRGKISNEEFYNLFCDYLEENKIVLSDDKSDEEESRIFYQLLEEDLIGYDILYSITDGAVFKDRFNRHFEKLGNDYHVAQISRINEEEDRLSFADLYKKWNGNMPRGWFALWCTCGHFFPLTPDLTEIDMENGEPSLKNLFEDKPVKILLKDLKSADFCSDSVIRIRLNDGGYFAIFPFKLNTSLLFDMVDNPLEILK